MSTISTGGGDQGYTALACARVAKDDVRIEALGALDELSAQIGFLHTVVTHAESRAALCQILHDLYALSTYVAGYAQGALPAPVDVTALEGEVGGFRGFVLPVGCEAAVRAQLCRVACRRAERRVVTAAREHTALLRVVPYLNRLSDYFFLFARVQNRETGVLEKYFRPSGAV